MRLLERQISAKALSVFNFYIMDIKDKTTPTVENSTLLVVDMQERLLPAIFENDTIIQAVQKLITGAEILGVDVMITEQYPRGLGHTSKGLTYPPDVPIFEKDSFSCMMQSEINDYLKKNGSHHLILCGVESHICVLKTALDAASKGYTVHVVADAISSRTIENKKYALMRMQQSGIFIVSVEMILFMLMDCAGTDQFRAISKLIK